MQTYTRIFHLKLSGYKGKDRSSGKERILSCVPSWNDVLGLEQWGRHSLKESIQRAFLSSLRVFANDCSTMTTPQKSLLLMLCDTLIASLEIHRKLRELKRVSAKQEKAKKNTPTLKSSPVQTTKAPSSEFHLIDWQGTKWLAKGTRTNATMIRPATPEEIRTVRTL